MLYEIAMRNNINSQMRYVLVRYFSNFSVAGNKMSKKEAMVHVTRLLNDNDEAVEECLGVSFRDWRARPFEFIPLFFWLQKLFDVNGIKSFKAIPMCAAKARDLIINNSGLADLLPRAFPGRGLTHAKIMADPRRFWEFFFDVGKFESTEVDGRGNPIKMFHSISTDGVAVSVRMTRIKRVQHQRSSRYEDDFLKQFDFVAGIDPGKKFKKSLILSLTS